MIKDEFIDEALQNIGVRFTDATKAPVAKEPPVNAKWEPVPKSVQSWYGCLVGCAKWVVICGGISTLLFLFWINELMAAEAAVPCVCACMMLGGYGVGKHTTEGRKEHEKENG